MYEDYITKIKSYLTVKRIVFICAGLLLLIGAWRIASNYISTAADYKRTLDRLESTEKQLAESRRINQQLKTIIERGRRLNDEAGRGIDRLEEYQREEGAGIDRLESNQRATKERVESSLESIDRAGREVKSSLELIERIERRNQAKQSD